MTDFITLDPPASPVPGKGETVLEVRDLSVDFGVDKKWVPAAIGLNYEVRAGEVLAIVGRVRLRQERQLDGAAGPAARVTAV